MKKLIYFLFILSIFCLGILPLSFGGQVGYASGENMEILSITYLNNEGERVEYTNNLFYQKEIQITIKTPYPKLSMEINEHNGTVYLPSRKERGIDTPSSTATIKIPDSGKLEVIFIGEDEFGSPKDSLGCYIASDNIIPIAPIIDPQDLKEYRKEPFSLAYTLTRDEHSGLDFASSRYYYKDEKGEIVFERKLEIESYNQMFVSGIDRNGTLYFELVDYAGNEWTYSYRYDRYGIPIPEIPVITLSDEGYAREVTVSISWGEKYDQNPFAKKEYSVTSKAGSIREYKEPFVVDIEGTSIVRAFYTLNGERKFVEKTVLIDRTSPSLTAMEESFRFNCNLRDELPITVSVQVYDTLSGIKEVRLSSGELLENYDGTYYRTSIMDMQSVKIIASDHAGNTTEFTFPSKGFDYKLIKEYNELFFSLDRDDYATSGWEKVLMAYDALSVYLISENPSTSQISQLIRNIETAVKGDAVINSVINDIPLGLDGDFRFLIKEENLNLKKGSIVRVTLSKVARDDMIVKGNIQEAKAAAGFNGREYTFNISLSDLDIGEASLVGSIDFSFSLPPYTQRASLFVDDFSTLTEVPTTLVDNMLKVNAPKVGDFYLILEVGNAPNPQKGITLGGKFYSLNLILISSAIFVGVMGITILSVVVAGKKKKKINSK